MLCFLVLLSSSSGLPFSLFYLTLPNQDIRVVTPRSGWFWDIPSLVWFAFNSQTTGCPVSHLYPFTCFVFGLQPTVFSYIPNLFPPLCKPKKRNTRARVASTNPNSPPQVVLTEMIFVALKFPAQLVWCSEMPPLLLIPLTNSPRAIQ